MKFCIVITAINVFLISNAFGQDTNDLIYNPSFEEHLTCPNKIEAYGEMTEVLGWWQPTGGSSDYYNKCGKKQTSVPKNKLGIQMPRSGVGMVGIYTSKTTYREYIQTQLKEKLLKGEKYKLTFYVSLSEYSSGAIATIGGLFTTYKLSDTVREMLAINERTMHDFNVKEKRTTYFKPQVVNPFEKPLTNTQQWMKIEGEFVAQGGEQYLTIGNFYPSDKSNVVDIADLTYLLPGAYYYIDDVSLVCLTCGMPKQIAAVSEGGSPITITKQKEKKPYEVGQVVVLKDIFFDFDKSILLPQSYIELNNLLDVLNKYPQMTIELRGHTDNYGTDAYNLPLSQRRAAAVYDYLIAHGIDKSRLSYKGYGAKIPIADNNTDEGRAKNRRVEFSILYF
ncbi:MAG: OmpA family protein [Bacteroidales bacterium]|nr:OmpA family protein [Bacteroidales bacterium]